MFLFNRTALLHFDGSVKPFLQDVYSPIISIIRTLKLKQFDKYKYDSCNYLLTHINRFIFIKNIQSIKNENRNIGATAYYQENQISQFLSDNFKNKNTPTNDK